MATIVASTPSWTGGAIGALASGAEHDGSAFLLAGAEAGVFASADGGASWGVVAPNDVLHSITSLAVTRDRWYAGGWTGLFTRAPASGAWRQVLSTPVHATGALELADGRRVLLAGTERDGVLRSENDGQSWQSATAGLLDRNVLTLAVAPARGDERVVLAGTEGGIYVSRNDGKAWRFASLPEEETAVQCLALAPDWSVCRLAFAGREGNGLLRSRDGGMRWIAIPFFAERGISAVAHTPAGAHSPLVAVAVDRSIAISDDGGETWTSFHEAAETIWSMQFIEGITTWTLLVGQAIAGPLRLDCRSTG